MSLLRLDWSAADMHAPGYVDLQVNGYVGVDFSDSELTEEAAVHACRALLSAGTAAFLPTIITSSTQVENMDERLASRMQDTSRCTIVLILAPSYRGGKAQVASRKGQVAGRKTQGAGGR